MSDGIVNPKERTQAWAMTDHATLHNSPFGQARPEVLRDMQRDLRMIPVNPIFE
jgi:hypothetical protein